MSSTKSKFNEKWCEINEYKDWLKKKDDQSGQCLFCVSSFIIGHQGISAINRHAKTVKHLNEVKSRRFTQSMLKFVQNENDDEKDKVSIAEACLVYHGVMHHHSYLSIGCGIKLNK
jgi:hypothetical protein